MGLLADLTSTVNAADLTLSSSLALAGSATAIFIVLAIVLNVLQQLLFKDPTAPPVVFHWVPFFGSTIVYGIDPYKFFFNCKQKYGDTFTFVLLGKKTTVCLGTKGNEFILNGKLKDLNAEEIYSPLTTPVFGTDVVYDCPNAKLMEQKKFVKFGLTSEALRSYVPLIQGEVEDFIKKSPAWKGAKGSTDISSNMAEITIYTASRTLQGKEVRDSFDSTFAGLYHDLDAGFSPINFMLPNFPFPHNKKRDIARERMVEVYSQIIKERREGKAVKKEGEDDMIWNLMASEYKGGKALPDHEIAHMMIALLMAGQHSSAATGTWIILRLATRPDIVEELYKEQQEVFGKDLSPLTYDGIGQLKLNAQVVKETLRLHSSIHSVMRKVKSPMPLEGTPYVIPTSHTLLAAPGVTSRQEQYFANAMHWDPHRWDSGLYDQKDADEDKTDYGYGLVSKGTASPYLPFGAGRHRCIGEQFAYVQLGTIVAALVRNFKFSNPADRKGVPDTDYTSLFSKPAGTTIINWERRDA